MQRKATAIWQGSLEDGEGRLTSPSGVLDGTAYSFRTRFEDGMIGTNPEELVAAAHAGCFAMALSMILGEKGLTPERIETEAKVTLERRESSFAVTWSHLTVKARVPGATPEAFAAAAEAAKAGCPISKLLNAEITMEARLGD